MLGWLCFIAIMLKRTYAKPVADGLSLLPVSFTGNNRFYVSHWLKFPLRFVPYVFYYRVLNFSVAKGITLFTLICDCVFYNLSIFLSAAGVRVWKRQMYNWICVRRWVGLRSAATLSGSKCPNGRRSEGVPRSRRHGTSAIRIITTNYSMSLMDKKRGFCLALPYGYPSNRDG